MVLAYFYHFLEKYNNETYYYCLLENKFDNSNIKNIKKCNYFAIKTTSFESKDIIENINKGIKEYIKSLNYQLLKLPIISNNIKRRWTNYYEQKQKYY